jgi:tRNA wybutosine-synthesizing protein 4
LPNGPNHPFAQKMLKHFENLQTPLQSVRHYQDLASQESRFLSAGWSSAYAHSLWDLWNDSTFIAPPQKAALSAIEPFDEWEDFALFASHYFLLIARTTSKGGTILSDGCFKHFEPGFKLDLAHLTRQIALRSTSGQPFRGIFSKSGGHRRFGAIMSSSHGLFGHYGGIGSQARLNTTHVYKPNDIADTSITIPSLEIEPRMCHTITALQGDSCLLVGGRTSPDRAMSDCWIYTDARWRRVEDIPTPLYRHCAVAIGLETTDPGVLVFGGKTCGGRVVDSWFLWRSSIGWVQVGVLGREIQPRFGAVMAAFGPSEGIVLGGMADDGSIGGGIRKWSIQNLRSNPSVHLTEYDRLDLPTGDASTAIYRFGACLTWSSIGLLLIGGISTHLLPQDYDIVCLARKLPTEDSVSRHFELSRISYGIEGERLLLAGHSVYAYTDSIIIAGGGALCFSFGSYWNQNIVTLNFGSEEQHSFWSFDKDQTCTPTPDQLVMGQPAESVPTLSSALAETECAKGVLRLEIETSNDFMRMINNSQPFIIEGLDLGPCQRDWTLELLKAKIGPHRSVRDRLINPHARLADLYRLRCTKPPSIIWISKLRIFVMSQRLLPRSSTGSHLDQWSILGPSRLTTLPSKLRNLYPTFPSLRLTSNCHHS